MATILKCKMCGGDIEVNKEMTVGTCLYCGSLMTLPRIDDDKKARIFNRANAYRLNNEFDKAYSAYEAIVNDDTEEAEAYWGLVLSEYGVEYVEDPHTHKRIPTCHRTKSQSVLDNVNYQMAYKFADAERKMLYRDDAESIDKIQRKILSLSNTIEPYDVFICYKETDDLGNRTEDSVLAQEIYLELIKNNIKPFFARISLEDRLGTDYEPYIYAALRSAKVMLVVTTNSEHCNAVWVKNEWMRYLSFMNEDDVKTLIPVYKNMFPEELPLELSKFQAQGMEKIGAIQDLVYGVQKLVRRERTEKNNIKLNQVIRDFENREAQKRKIKKIALMVAIIAASLALVIIGPMLGYRIYIAAKSTTVTSGIPDSDKYLFFTVEVNEDNWDDYLYFDEHPSGQIVSTGVRVGSKAYDEGWYVWTSTVVICTTEDGFSPFRSSGGVSNMKVGEIESVEGEIVFVSENFVKEVKIDDVLRRRNLVLKDGRKSEEASNSTGYFNGSQDVF